MGVADSKLHTKDLDGLMRITGFNGDELRTWYHKFMKDTHSKTINKAEFTTKYAAIFPGRDADEFADHVFRIFDVNNDGRLNFREFITGLSLSMKAPFEDKLYSVFKLYDVDGNGDVTRDEVDQILKAIRACGRDKSVDIKDDEIFLQLDANNDGHITWGEFRKGVLCNRKLKDLFENVLPAPQ